jgi:hypothetical protein
VTNASFNQQIRRAARRGLVLADPLPEAPRAHGDVGIGRGGAAGRNLRPDPRAQINVALRLAARQAANRIDVVEGVDLARVLNL